MSTIQLFRNHTQRKIEGIKEVLKTAQDEKASELTITQLRNKISLQKIILEHVNEFIEGLADDQLDQTLNNL